MALGEWIYKSYRSSTLVPVHWPNMWSSDSKGAANQQASKNQKTTTTTTTTKVYILRLDAFGASKYSTKY